MSIRIGRYFDTPRRGRGFSLLESLLAVTVLGVVVIAVTSAVTTANALSFEGQKRILAAIAVDDFAIEATTLPYDTLKTLNGTEQKIGQMTTLDGVAYPPLFWSIGREVSVTEQTIQDQGLGVSVKGLVIVIRAVDDHGVIFEAQTFIAEPVS